MLFLFLFMLKKGCFKAFILNDANKISSIDLGLLGLYGFLAVFAFALCVSGHMWGLVGISNYSMAMSLFFMAFFISKLCVILYGFFYGQYHASLVLLTSFPRLSLFLLAFVFLKNILHQEIVRHLVPLAICVFFSFTILEAILKFKLFSRN